jgi:hypothetical protein
MTAREGDGWSVLPWDPARAAWAGAARQVARGILGDPEQQARWLRHGETWFVGVDALPNDPDGSMSALALPQTGAGFPVFAGPWHRAQLSVMYPGYPRRDEGETEAAHRFRRDRDGAHLDGLLAEGEAKRRHLREPHAFILGLPLTDVTAQTAPFVVWEGSQHVIGRAFADAFAGLAPSAWGDVDVTEVYQAARREVFETCPRAVITARPGEAILCHRRAIHGVAPWGDAEGPEDGRMIVWFRPILSQVGDWLSD